MKYLRREVNNLIRQFKRTMVQIYLLYPRYLRNVIFRYVIREITHVIILCYQLNCQAHYPPIHVVLIATT